MPKLIRMSLVFAATTPLGANGTVTSGNISTAYASKVTGTVYADQPGTLYIDWSSDGGTNWDGCDTIPVSAGTPTTIFLDVKTPTMRVRYVNGATAQTVFRLYVFLK